MIQVVDGTELCNYSFILLVRAQWLRFFDVVISMIEIDIPFMWRPVFWYEGLQNYIITMLLYIFSQVMTRFGAIEMTKDVVQWYLWKKIKIKLRFPQVLGSIPSRCLWLCLIPMQITWKWNIHVKEMTHIQMCYII